MKQTGRKKNEKAEELPVIGSAAVERECHHECDNPAETWRRKFGFSV